MSRDKLKKMQEEASSVYSQFEKCQRYKEEKGIILDAKRAINYYEGKQWLENKTKLPFEKPMVNIIQYIVDSKASSINSKSLSIEYTINNDKYSTDNVTRFSKYQLKDMEQEAKLWEASLNGLIKGTYCLMWYWDEDAIGQSGEIDGAVRMQVIDMRDVAVADPTETDVQKQEYVIIRSRESVKAVREQCETLNEQEKKKYIVSDDTTSYYDNDSDENMVYVYTKMFRQNGEVYFEKSTQEVLIQDPRCLNPSTTYKKLKEMREEEISKKANSTDGIYENEPVNKNMMTEANELNEQEMIEDMHYKANLYPIEINSFYKRDNSIFGISTVVQLIPMQKIINQLLATVTLTAVKSALPTVVVKAGALGTGTLDLSKGGGMIVDYSPQGTDGIKVLNTGSIPTTHYELAQSMISLVKDNSRASDVLDQNGNIPSGISGYAVQQYMQIQDKPIAQWQQVLSRSVEKEARILEMFYKLYYRRKRFTYELTDAEFLDANKQLEVQGLGQLQTNTQESMFNGEDYIDTPFNVSIEVGESAKFSEATMVSILESLFLNGTIEKISPDNLMIFANLIPDAYFPKKSELKRLIREKSNSLVTQLTQQNEQLQQALEQMQMNNQAQTQAFNTKISEYNEQLKKLGALNNYNRKVSKEDTQVATKQQES